MHPVAPQVSAVVAALSEQRTVQPGQSQPVSVGGYSGRLLQFQVPSDLDVGTCWDGQGGLRPMGVWGSWTSVFPGWTYRTWVLDVEGDPLVVMAAHGPRTTPTELAEVADMVEGMDFVAPE